MPDPRRAGGRGRRPGGSAPRFAGGAGAGAGGGGGGRSASRGGTPRDWRGSRDVVPGRGAPGGDVPFDPDALVGAFAVYQGPQWTVDSLLLVDSHPGEGRGGGPRYTTVARFPLGSPGSPE